MWNCNKELVSFYKNEVTLPKAERDEMRNRRNTNRSRLKSGLAKNEQPASTGQTSQGSYAMWTMVQHTAKDYDIDDGVYFNKEDLVGAKGADKSALEVRKMVCEAVTNKTLKIEPKVLKNCVRVEYENDGYHVDLPVYRLVSKDGFGNDILNPYYELASSDWKKSDGQAVTKWFAKEVGDKSLDEQKSQLRRVVKYLKTFARSRDSWKPKTASGFMITKLVADHYVGDADRDDQALRSTMKAIRNKLLSNKQISHPVLDGEFITTGSEDPRATFFYEKLDEAINTLSVLDENDCNDEKALKAWDKVFATTHFTDNGGKSTQAKISKDQTPPKSAVNPEGGNRYG